MQVILNSLIQASQIAVIAVGVSMCYSILRFANFAQIQYAVVGGYLLYVLAVLLGLPLLLGSVLAMVLTGGLAIIIHWLVFDRIRDASSESKMIASWGVALVLRSVVAATMGGSALYLDAPATALPFEGIFFTTLDVAVILIGLVAIIGLHLLLQRTRIGTALRAISSNFNLARARGIPTNVMILFMWFVSGAFAALGGILIGLSTQLTPNMDLTILLPVFAAVAIGGMVNMFGVIIGAVLLSLAQNVVIAIDFGSLVAGAPWFLPTQFKDLVAVVALVAVLLLNLHSRLARFGKARA